MFNNELYDSVKTILNEAFSDFIKEIYKEKGNQSKNPNDIAKTFPIEIVSRDDIFDILHEAVQKKAYGHFGYFSKYEPSTVARDGRLSRRKVYTDFRQLICFRGEVYELCDNYWIERKVYQDIRGKWHLWDGTYNIEVWIDGDKRSFTTNPPKPTKKYPIES